jgi:two-component system cell cycle sensor histidine kinase/response regulator CckA
VRAPRSDLTGLSIEWKLPLMAAGVLLAVTAALCSAAYVQVSRSVERTASERLSGVAAQMVSTLAKGTGQLSQVATTLGGKPAVQALLGAAGTGVHRIDSAAIRLAMPADTSIIAAEFWDAERRRVYSAGTAADRVIGLNSDDFSAYRAGSDSGRIGRLRAIGDTVVFATIAPVSAPGPVASEDPVAGYVVVWRRITNRARSTEQLAQLIGDRDGTLLIGSTPGAWTDQATLVERPPVDVRHAETVRYRRVGGRERLAALAPVPGVPWMLAVELPRDVVLAPARRFVRNFALIALVILALGLAGIWALSRVFTRPLTRLTAAADAISAGNQAVRVPVGRDDEAGRLAAAFNHMLDRVAEEASARTASEEHWRSLFEHNPHPMWMYDLDTFAILRVNEAAVRQYGYSRAEFTTLTLRDLYAPEDQPALDAVLGTMEPDSVTMYAMRHRRKDGRTIQVEARGRPMSYPGHRARLVTATDTTERAQLEDQLRQSQKMEAVGRLAGGVAHDFNNLLTVIGGCSEQLAGSDLDPDDRASVSEIAAAASRAAALTRQLLMFSRKQIVQLRLLDLNDVVIGLGPMLRRLLYENIELITSLGSTPAPVIADVSQLEQVIVNLAVNAADAMPEGGTLTLETAVVTLDALYVHSHAEVIPGRYVRLVVSDTGVGMDADIIGKIFEPFFTTKPVGSGTGLGLATVYGIAKQLGGHIWVYSEPGLGATFKVYLPIAGSDQAAEVTSPIPAAATGAGSNQTVMLVEDEGSVRQAARRMLERSGYAVVEAANGQEALDLIASHPGPVHAVVTDLMMPGMDGRTFADRLHATKADVPVVFMSGYTDDAVIRRGIVDSSHTFLQKPFTRDQLTSAVAGAISAKG